SEQPTARASRRRPRRHRTRWTVRLADRIATAGITIGGIGTILTVSAVCVFLVAVVVPLFLPGSVDHAGRFNAPPEANSLLHVGVDEYRTMAWAIFRDGTIRIFRLDTGAVLDETHLVESGRLTAFSTPVHGDLVALGLEGGRVQVGSIRFVTDFPDPDQLPDEVRRLPAGGVTADGASMIQRTPEGQLRRQRLRIDLHEAVAVDSSRTIVLLDLIEKDSAPVVSTLTSDGVLRLNKIEQYENLMTGEIVQELRSSVLPTPFPGGETPPVGDQSEWPAHLVILQGGTGVVLVWADGHLLRYDTRNLENPKIAERGTLSGVNGSTLTTVQMLLGQATILAGDSDGTVRAWFKHHTEDARTPDGATLAAAHTYDGPDAPVTAIGSSPRSRIAAIGYGDGRIRIYQTTSGKRIADITADPGKPVTAVAITPKNDGVVALTPDHFWHWDMDVGHPEATLAALFTPVWYENYEKPAHVWQSSGATDDFEPKLGMWPLVFGTLKATLYSMIFGAPLALLAAIFSSEFMAPVLRNKVKTSIEFMASLPSVVLGFLAALVFAPFVQRLVPTVMMSFLTVPGTILIGAYVWQLLPQSVTLRFSPYRIVLLLLLLPAGMAAAMWLGPLMERLFFLGDIRLWLDGNQGSGFGGWFFLTLPAAALAVAVFMTRGLGPWFRDRASTMDRSRVGMLDLGRFLAGAGLTVVIALALAWLIDETGLDPRGSGAFLGTYVQRNALVVGFVMGFAIIPIIYTIAEDALSAVPDHLRAASLGAGATPWQTAFRIVIPTAMSGLFSALMIGLGRAVGETMIVLMAAGNTPILDINIFNGFRTLSANIAVELPEAVRDSTHYRTLFLAALILFAMTFVINTVAEIVRLRFRKRSYQL
ncbi:MAG: ABC transporter permease subunit, partial [bacterium]